MDNFFNILNYSMLLLLAMPITAQAQIVDELGNYYRNGNVDTGASPWKVVVNDLRCRRSASLQSPIVRTYQKDDLLQVEQYRGGSDEVLINPLDKIGKPWMPVHGKNIEDVCFVRANSRYIEPVKSQ
jgi:hypothetical protein